jgi:hypothetical protein
MESVFLSLIRGISCLAIIILLLFNSNMLSQVTIKERVEINPNKEIGRIYSDAVDHVIRIEHSWTPASRREGNIRVITSCDDTINSGWSAGGTNSLTISPARGWRYHILFEGRWYDPIYARWRYDYTLSNSIRTVYVDDIPQSWPLEPS